MENAAPLSSGFLHDLRYAVRQVRRSPALATTVILSLALGIGANTAIFSLVNAMFLRQLHVESPERLMAFQYRNPEVGLAESLDHTHSGRGGRDSLGRSVQLSISWPSFTYLEEHAKSVSDVVGFVPLGMLNKPAAVVNSRPMYVDGEMVTARYFPALGVAPILGRAILPDDEKPEAPRVGVISHRFWTRAYGRSKAAVGDGILLNGVPVTVVGVMPASFTGLEIGRSPDIWIQMGPQPGLTPWGVHSEGDPRAVYAAPDWWWLEVVCRLKPDATVEQARTELEWLFRRSLVAGLDSAPAPEKMPLVSLTPAAQGLNTMSGRFSTRLAILMAAVGLVLLVACANVATLLLARSAARRKEMVIRLALGAPRFRLVRQLLTESFLYAGAGCALGLLMARWGARMLLTLFSQGRDPIPIDVGLDPEVLGFTIFLSLVTTLLFGLAPALRATRPDLRSDLTERSATAPGAGVTRRLRGGKLLVAAQLAMSLPLVIGAGLFLRTLANLEHQRLGFDPDGVLTFQIDPTKAGFKEARLFAAYSEIRERLGTLPGVRGAAASSLGLITGWVNNGPISVEGEASGGDPRDRHVYWNYVTPAFFETLGMPLLLGRAIDDHDTADRPKVAVINETMARQFFPTENPIGRRFWFGRTREGQPIEIVGVVGDAKYASLRDAAPPTAYVPHTQSSRPLSQMTYYVRAAGDPAPLVPAVAKVVGEAVPGVPIGNITTQARQIEASLGEETTYARLFSFFGVLALLLASVGLYGTMSYALSRRTREIGIRMALGAASREVLRSALLETLAVAAVGGAAGGMLAWTGSRFVRSLLFEITPLDGTTIASAVLLMMTVTAASGYLPARRASRLDPLRALREE